MNQLKIKIETVGIMEAKRKLDRDLKALQDLCKHPDASKVYRGNTGNYDPSSDCYWTEFSCPDCQKRWTEYKD